MPKKSSRRKKKKNLLSKVGLTGGKGGTKYLLLAVLFVGSIFSLGLYSLYKTFNQSFASAYSEEAKYHVDIRERDFYSIGFLTVEDDFTSSSFKLSGVSMLFVNTNFSEVLLVEFPLGYVFEMPGKYGEESLGSLLGVAALPHMEADSSCEKDCLQRSLPYVEKALQKLTGTVVDKIVLAESNASEIVGEFLVQGSVSTFFNRTSLNALSQSIITNLSFSEALYHYNTMRAYSAHSCHGVTFSDPDTLDTRLRELNYNSSLAREALSVTVLNGTGLPGFAAHGARVARNRGGYVVSMENAPSIEEKTYIVSDHPESVTVDYLSKGFGASRIFSKEESPVNVSSVERADILLVIGLDNVPNY